MTKCIFVSLTACVASALMWLLNLQVKFVEKHFAVFIEIKMHVHGMYFASPQHPLTQTHSWPAVTFSVSEGSDENEALWVLSSIPAAAAEVLPSQRALPESALLRLSESTLLKTPSHETLVSHLRLLCLSASSTSFAYFYVLPEHGNFKTNLNETNLN